MKEKLLIFLILAALVILISIPIIFIVSISKEIQEHKKIKNEWQQKVNSCILNENYRKDCKLILYRDVQIHNDKNARIQRDSVDTAAMTGAMVGGFAATSMGLR